MEEMQEESGSAKKTEEHSSIFEKQSFQDFSLKKFAELMQVKNMKKFKDDIQKTFREYNKAEILSMSDKKEAHNKTSCTPKKTRYASPGKYSKRDLELDRIGYEQMKLNSEKKNKLVKQMSGSNSSLQKLNNTTGMYRTNLSLEKYKKEISFHDFSEDVTNSVHKKENLSIDNEITNQKQCQDYILVSPKKKITHSQSKSYLRLEQPAFESPEQSKSSTVEKYNSKVNRNPCVVQREIE